MSREPVNSGKKALEDESKPDFDIHVLEQVESPELIDVLCDAYESSFDDDSKVAAQIQRCYTRVEFEAALKDPGILKVLAASGKGEVFTCCMVGTRDEDAIRAYANPRRIRAEMNEGEKMWYVTALFALKRKRGATVGVIHQIMKMVRDQGVVLGYDHSEHNDSVMPGLIAHAANELNRMQPGSGKLDDMVVGQQTFHVARFSSE